jgi:hypothetical protein
MAVSCANQLLRYKTKQRRANFFSQKNKNKIPNSIYAGTPRNPGSITGWVTPSRC